MVKIGPFLLISLWLTSCAIRGSNIKKCVGTSDNIQPVQTTVCKGLYYEPVCLVCGDKGSHVKWLFGETLVAQRGINFGHVDSVDKCDDKIPSIGLASCYQAMSYLISCKLENRKTNLATFKLECIGPELLIIERNSLEFLEDNQTLVNPSNEINLVCNFRQVLPPVSLQWFVDGELFETKRFTKKFDQPSSYSLSLAINSSQVNRSIICTSYGNRAPNMSRSIFLSRRRQISDQATADDYVTMRTLAKSLSTFKMDDRFVRILFMSTQETPMVFFYESMNFGTLQDHVKNRFASHAMTTNEDGKSSDCLDGYRDICP
ncbi:uncharacterized protein [Apostichopus japonicus]|uniref:uncharacterized protein n=1 Tax=Stichopus japonicus TaxID=307972 RepID=UPI003AB2442F